MKLLLFVFTSFFFVSFAVTAKSLPCPPSDCREFPADAGFINVKDFGAKGDGITDDTAAINAALAASGDDTKSTFWQDKFVYFPAGIYLVSSPIEKRYKDGRYASGMILIGVSPAQTIIKLQDGAKNYQDPNNPKAVIYTSSKLLNSAAATAGGKDYAGKGEGNDAYNNFIENLTVNVGKDNAGAVGIDYLGNNFGAIRNVTIKAEDKKSGTTGISLTRKWPGPSLLSNVTIEGFYTGINAEQTEYGITMSDIKLSGQHGIGLRNNHNVISAQNLTVSGAPQSLVNQARDGLIVMIGGKLDNYTNNGTMNIRGAIIGGTEIDAVFEKNKKISASTQAWSLPIEEPPPAFKEPIKNWVKVKHISDEADATGAIRKAFASGANTVYFPHGIYNISENIFIPPSVKRIFGMGSTIQAVKDRGAKLERNKGFFRSQSGGEPLTIEHLAFENSWRGDQVGFESSGKRTVVLRDVVGAGVTAIKRTATGGEIFAENICCGTMDFAGKNEIRIKQLNTEGGGTRIVNNGAPLQIIGIKTEGNCTILENKNNAQSEVSGGLIYMVQPTDSPRPAFINSDSRLSVSYAEEAFNPKATYKTHILNNKENAQNKIEAKDLPERNQARTAPLLTADSTQP